MICVCVWTLVRWWLGGDSSAPDADPFGIMYICLCNAITDRQIVAAAEQGARSPEDLAHGLGVGLGCGRCTSCAVTLLQETVAALTRASVHRASSIPEAAQ